MDVLKRNRVNFMLSEARDGVKLTALQNSEPYEHGGRGEAQPLLEKGSFLV